MLRRTIGFIITVGLTAWAGYQLAWHQDFRDRLGDHPWQSLGLLALVVVAVAVIIHSTISPHHGSAIIGLVLGVAAVLWGNSLYDGIKWSTLGLIVLVFVSVILLWAFTVLDKVPNLPKIRIPERLRSLVPSGS